MGYEEHNGTLEARASLSSSQSDRDADDTNNGAFVSDPPTGGTSSIGEAVFNFTNSIVGAGAIGLGGAIATSGGLISVVSILFFAIVTKLSLDMLVSLTVQTEGAKNSYEELGKVAFGTTGRAAVLISKKLYSFGCLVAYIIVVKDNFASASRHLIYGNDDDKSREVTKVGDDTIGEYKSWFESFLDRDDLIAFLLSATVILPLCLLRDMTPLAKFSVVSVFSMLAIVIIVVAIFGLNPGGHVRMEGGSTYENWFEIRSGLLESLGTFVFTFVSQHTVHLTYESLDEKVRNVKSWKTVSLYSIMISTAVSLSVGLFVYMTFWEKTESDIFEMYPPMPAIDVAKLLLCVTMLLTFPLPFFTCREMIILVMNCFAQNVATLHLHTPVSPSESDDDLRLELQKSLLTEEFGPDLEDISNTEPIDTELPTDATEIVQRSWMKPGEERQLTCPYHILLTVLLWGVTTALAIVAPSLGDVLDLVGCATGTVIAFVLPALFSFRLRGYTHLSAFILLVGGSVGLVGTYFSTSKLISDSR